MKLTYRGVSYESNPPILELTEGEIDGKYRGVNYRYHYPRHIPVQQPVVDLKYRGAAYSIGDPIDVEASLLRRRYGSPAAPTDDSTTTQAVPTVTTRREVLEKLTNAHLTNIRNSLEHRIEVAKAQGDQNLIRILQAEAEQIA